MAIGRFYTMEFKNVEETFVKVLIGDKTIQTDGTPEIIPLDPGGDPLRLSTIDNNENKYTPIKSQQATITFLSNENNSLLDFSEGADDRFPVTVLYGTTIVFYGFLSLTDNSEPFLPPRNEVVLIANDKLAALKDIPWTNEENINPTGKYKLANILALCLNKTGLSLQLRVINNLRHGSGSKVITATFGSPSDPFILMSNADTVFFYEGQRVLVSGTASNNVEFTVVSVNTGFVGVIGADINFTLEAGVNATFTDITSAEHIYNHYLDAKTFENGIGVSEDCYTVIEKILGYDCFITQYRECWWICRVDEYDNNSFYVSRFDENGTFIDNYIDVNLSKNIGFNELHWFSQESTNVQPKRPIGSAKLIFNFNNPIEIVCNQDFDRGEFIEDLPAETNEDGVTRQVKAYDFDCWDSLSKEGGGQPNTLTYYDQVQIAGVKLYVKKFFYNDTETNRELFIEAAPGTGAGVPYVKSQEVRVRIKDKISFSIDLKYSNIGSSSGYINTPVMIGLFADSGRIYWWKAYDVTNPDANQVWELITITDLVPHWYLGADITEEWSLSFTSPPVPETGSIFIYLINQYGESIRVHYSAPQVDVLAFINGSYRTYKGHYNKVTRVEPGYLSKIEDEVFIADAERELFKGALFFLATMFKLTSRWYDASKIALGQPDETKPFGKIQIFALWNQYRLSNRVFQYQFQSFGPDIPSLVHKFSITDATGHSTERYFLMLSKDADLKLCEMNGTIEQCYHTVEGKEYESPHEFKYIS